MTFPPPLETFLAGGFVRTWFRIVRALVDRLCSHRWSCELIVSPEVEG